MNWRKIKAAGENKLDCAVCTNEKLVGNNCKSIEARSKGRMKGDREGEVRAKVMGHTGEARKCSEKNLDWSRRGRPFLWAHWVRGINGFLTRRY